MAYTQQTMVEKEKSKLPDIAGITLIISSIILLSIWVHYGFYTDHFYIKYGMLQRQWIIEGILFSLLLMASGILIFKRKKWKTEVYLSIGATFLACWLTTFALILPLPLKSTGGLEDYLLFFIISSILSGVGVLLLVMSKSSFKS